MIPTFRAIPVSQSPKATPLPVFRFGALRTHPFTLGVVRDGEETPGCEPGLHWKRATVTSFLGGQEGSEAF